MTLKYTLNGCILVKHTISRVLSKGDHLSNPEVTSWLERIAIGLANNHYLSPCSGQGLPLDSVTTGNCGLLH